MIILDYALETKGICKSFGGVIALSDININVKKGTIHALVGENGAGKSTLINIINGVLPADSGEVFIDGKRAAIKNRQDALNNGIALVPQELALVPGFSVAENIYLGREPISKLTGKINRHVVQKQCEQLLDRLEIDLQANTKVSELSVSEQELVVIARAFAENVRILVLDEPTARLGEKEINHLLSYLLLLKDRGITIIYISHHLDEVFRISDEITVLRDGKHVTTCVTSETSREEIIRLMVARDLNTASKSILPNVGDEVLRVENLSAAGRINNASFDLKQGEILGIAGLVGAGRTELIRCVLGIDKKDTGAVYVHGRKAQINSLKDAIELKMVLVPEERRQQGLVAKMSIRENITLPSLGSFTRKFGYVDREAEVERTSELIKRLKIKCPSVESPVNNLSGGNQQKVVLAKWLNTNADVYIFDEPTRGIDVGSKAEIHNIIRSLAKNGAGVIVISSELTEVISLASRVLVMCEGSITAVLSQKQISAESIMSHAIPANDKEFY